MSRQRCGAMTVRSQPDVGGKVTYLAAGCKAWRCKVCGPKKADKLRKGIAKAAEEKKLTRMLTLTLDTKFLTEAELKDSGIGYIRQSWRKLRVYLQREYGSAIQFIAIVELQERKVAHLHILVDRYLPQEWVKNAWVAVGGGRMVNIKWVDVHRVSSYLSKYLSKDSALGLPRGVRRYSVSRGIKLWERVKSGWSLDWVSLRLLREKALASQNKIAELSWDTSGNLEMMVVAETG